MDYEEGERAEGGIFDNELVWDFFAFTANITEREVEGKGEMEVISEIVDWRLSLEGMGSGLINYWGWVSHVPDIRETN